MMMTWILGFGNFFVALVDTAGYNVTVVAIAIMAIGVAGNSAFGFGIGGLRRVFIFSIATRNAHDKNTIVVVEGVFGKLQNDTFFAFGFGKREAGTELVEIFNDTHSYTSLSGL